MAEKFSLQPLLELMQTRTDEATRRLGTLIAAEQSARTRLEMLEGYRAEYEQRLNQSISGGVSPQVLRNFQDFIARIDEAVEQQRLAVQDSERNTLAGKNHWQVQNSKLKALDTLSIRHDLRVQHQENRREQKLQDEFSTRKYALRSSEDD